MVAIQKKLPLVSIVIPTYNAQSFIVQAISSVLKTRYPNFEVIIVDDQSTDRTVQLIKEEFKDPRLCVVVCKQKKLAAGARNIGCALSKGKYIALLDHDIEVDPSWINEMLKIFDKNPEVGTVQSKVLDIKRRKIIQHAGIRIQAYLGWVIAVGMGSNSDSDYLEERESFANATGLMFKKSVWRALDGFDEDLAINTDDWDFNWRSWILGYKQMYAPKAITYHWSKKQSTRDEWIKRAEWEFHFAKVHYIFIKNYEFVNILKYLPVYLVVNFGRGVFNLVFRFNPSPLVASIISLWWLLMKFPSLLKKRSHLKKNRKIKDKYLTDNLMDCSFVPAYFIKHWIPTIGIGKNISTEKPYS